MSVRCSCFIHKVDGVKPAKLLLLHEQNKIAMIAGAQSSCKIVSAIFLSVWNECVTSGINYSDKTTAGVLTKHVGNMNLAKKTAFHELRRVNSFQMVITLITTNNCYYYSSHSVLCLWFTFYA